MGDERGLVVLVLGVVAGDELAADLLGPQVLGPARRVVGDDGVGGVEDALRRPVVLLEHDDRRVGERLLEPHEVAVVGPAELVDRLIVVADDHDVAVLLGEQAHELPLGDVRVLELVDEHVAEAVAPALEHVGVLAEQPHGEQQQVVEVGRRRVEQPALVLAVDLGDAPLGGTGRSVERLLGGHELVLQRRDLRVQPAGREPLGVEVEVAAHVVDEPDGVGLVVDRERRPVSRAPAPRAAGCARTPSGTSTPTCGCATGPTSAPTRSFISPAALLVNVIARSSNGETPCSPIRYAMRWVRTRVLPEPAPATTRSGPSGARDGLALHRVEPREQVGACGGAHEPPAYRRRGQMLGAGLEAELARRAVMGGPVVAPRAQQPRAVLVQRDGERAGLVSTSSAKYGSQSLSSDGASGRCPWGRAGSASARRRTARCCGSIRSVPYAQPPVGGRKGYCASQDLAESAHQLAPSNVRENRTFRQDSTRRVTGRRSPARPACRAPKRPVATGAPRSRRRCANASTSGSACSGARRRPTTGAGRAGCRRRA